MQSRTRTEAGTDRRAASLDSWRQSERRLRQSKSTPKGAFILRPEIGKVPVQSQLRRLTEFNSVKFNSVVLTTPRQDFKISLLVLLGGVSCAFLPIIPRYRK